MNLSPIALLSRQPSQTSFDDAGNQIVKGQTAPPSQPSYTTSSLPRHFLPPKAHTKVLPLAYFCVMSYLKRLECSERAALLDISVRPIPYAGDHQLFQQLIPHMHGTSQAVRLEYVDPRLWLTIILCYWSETLPEALHTYPMPLADVFLPYLQYIEPMDRFALVVVLDLYQVTALDDSSILELSKLHQLAVLDCSKTNVTTLGVKRLADSLTLSDEGEMRRGPWKLRSLSLRLCNHVDDKVALSMRLFPLLSIVDLRGTNCTGPPSIHGWKELLQPSYYTDLFHPAPVAERMPTLAKLAIDHGGKLFPSDSPPLAIFVNSLYHPKPPTKTLEHPQSSKNSGSRTHATENGYFVLGPDGKFGSGSVDVLERREKAKADMVREMQRGARAVGDWSRSGLPRLEARYPQVPKVPLFKSNIESRDLQQAVRTVFAETLGAKDIGRTDPGDTSDQDDASFWSNVADRESALELARTAADSEHRAREERREHDARKRRERQAIEDSRDAGALSERESLNRRLILIRVPPPYDALDEAVDKWRATRRRLLAIKEAKRQNSELSDEVLSINKKRRTGQSRMWADMEQVVGADHDRTLRDREEQGGSQSSGKNPWSKPPAVDAKKVVRF